MLAYAKAKGLYGGLSIEGGVLQQQRSLNNVCMTSYGIDGTYLYSTLGFLWQRGDHARDPLWAYPSSLRVLGLLL